MGTSPVTQATPNKGYEAAGLQQLGVVLKKLESLVPLFGSTSEPGKAVLECMKKIAPFVPDGSVTPAAEKNSLQQQMEKNAQNNQQMAAMRQGGAPGGAPPGAGAPPQARAA